MFINTPATERRVLRFFRLRWNATAIQFFLERDETGETPISIYRRDATGETIVVHGCVHSERARKRVSPKPFSQTRGLPASAGACSVWAGRRLRSWCRAVVLSGVAG